MKDARWSGVPALRRPHYTPTERMAILELRAAHGWTTQQTAAAFRVSAATIASWMHRIDEQGPLALVQIHEPADKFPDFVRSREPVRERLGVTCAACLDSTSLTEIVENSEFRKPTIFTFFGGLNSILSFPEL